MTIPLVPHDARYGLPGQDQNPTARADDRDQPVAGGVGGKQGARAARTRVAALLRGSHDGRAMREADRCRVSWAYASADVWMSGWVLPRVWRD